jgi:hypothetical protein
MLPAKRFPLSHRLFAEYIWNIRDQADEGDIYPLSCHFVNLDIARQQSLLRWPCLPAGMGRLIPCIAA